ncbi:hypothetical protein Tco_1108312 [Tanacetum coccineum]
MSQKIEALKHTHSIPFVLEYPSSSPIPVVDNEFLIEEVDTFLVPEDSIPPGIESDFDSEALRTIVERTVCDEPMDMKPLGVTKIVLLGLESIPLTRFIDTRGCVFNKAVRVIHSLNSVVGYQCRSFMRMKRYHVVPYGELNGVPVALVARFGVVSKSTDRILISHGG